MDDDRLLVEARQLERATGLATTAIEYLDWSEANLLLLIARQQLHALAKVVRQRNSEIPGGSLDNLKT